MPERIQRRRTKGFVMPAAAIYVGRPSRWGNPYRIGEKLIQIAHVRMVRPDGADAEDIVWAYRHALCWNILPGPVFLSQVAELAGHDLACWCPIGQPCHADVLLELANQGEL